MIGTKRYPFPDNFRDAMALPEHQFKSLFGRQVVKGWNDIRQIEAFLRSHQEITTIVELGAGDAIHTLYMAVLMALRDGNIWAYDAADNWLPRTWAMIESIHGDNVLCKSDVFQIYGIIEVAFGGPTMLYCDIGPKDIVTFGPLLKSGDYAIVHDWKHKDYEPHVTPLVERGILEYYERDVWESTGAHMGFRRL